MVRNRPGFLTSSSRSNASSRFRLGSSCRRQPAWAFQADTARSRAGAMNLTYSFRGLTKLATIGKPPACSQSPGSRANHREIRPLNRPSRWSGRSVDMFVEYVGDYDHQRPSQVLDTGGAWRFTRTQQIDFSLWLRTQQQLSGSLFRHRVFSPCGRDIWRIGWKFTITSRHWTASAAFAVGLDVLAIQSALGRSALRTKSLAEQS
jgi:hypothetical protein